MIKKYGKSYGNIAGLKSNFATDNDALLANQMRIAEIYGSQPARERCKICGGGVRGG